MMNFNNDIGDPDSECPLFVQQYSIIKSILEKLTIRDLLSASKVCREWSQVGRLVRKQRKNKATTFLWHPYTNEYGSYTNEVFEYYNACNVSEEVTRWITSNAPSLGFPTPHELTQDQSWSSLFPLLRSAIIKDFNESFYEPQFMVMVATASVDEYMPSGKNVIIMSKKKSVIVLN